MSGRQYRNKYVRNDRNDKYYAHDDRAQDFKFNKGRGSYRGKRPFRSGFNGRVQRDEAGPFVNNNSNKRMEIYERGRGKGKHFTQKRTNFSYGWNEIVIKNVQGADGDEVIATIRKYLDDDFSPVMTEFSNTSTLNFFVEDAKDAANAMLNLSNRISLDNGQKLKITVFDRCPEYKKQLSPEKYEIVKKVMSDRFSIEMNRIDLKAFHKDPKLIQAKVHFPLYIYEALTIITHIIKANIPQVSEIDLSNNKIYNPTALEGLSGCHQLRIDFHNNKICRLGLLCRLKKLDIIGLNITGNPLQYGFKSNELYISNMTKIFPKLLYLDGMELPKVPGFDVADACKIPPSRGSQYFSEEAEQLIKPFIELYYQLFEAGDRRALEAAYTEDACFSILCVIPDHIPSSWHITNKFFNMHNRSLLKVLGSHKRFDNLVQGKKNIVDLLCGMPAAEHIPSTFVIDVPIAQPQLMHVCLRGVMSLLDGSTRVLRSFSRSLIIVPVGSGICISNEEFFIGMPSPEQKVAMSKSRVIKSLPSSSSAGMPAILDGLETIQIQMVEQFSQRSRMRPQFSRECLEKNEWNFDKAAEIFVNLKNENKIPAEYYVE